MGKQARGMRGFTLIASLLVLVLLSGVAVGLMFLVNSQQHISSNDTEDNLAYYGAESGMEKMTSDLATLYAATQSPQPAQISAIATFPPTFAQVGSMTYVETIAQQLDPVTQQPVRRYNTISAGNEQGLSALTEPMLLQVQATRPSGASVNMFRRVEVAFIPVFQFGVFSDSDLSYFAGPHFGFEGRVHTNGNLYLAANSGPLVLDAKISAFGEIIRDRLANDWNQGGYAGSVYAPTQTGGCAPYILNTAPLPPNGSPCKDLGLDSNESSVDYASWNGSIPIVGGGGANINFATNASAFNGFVTNHTNGAKKLSLPFVQGNNPLLGGAGQQIQIIRKGLASDSTSVANSKLYDKAAIRVLIADTEALLAPERPWLIGDPDNINLAGGPAGYGRQFQINGGSYARIAMANAGVGAPDWTGGAPFQNSSLTVPNVADPTTGNWNLVNGWIRVEYLDNAGTPGWHGITRQLLGYGFGRGTAIPTTPLSNTAHPAAILVLQELKNGAVSPYDLPLGNASGTNSQYSWYPINFWDPREGLPRDVSGGLTGSQCNANGIMNAVELDVGNLSLWLQGSNPYGGGSGLSVNSSIQNGYVLYFSDRRGMRTNPNAAPVASINGEYGFEDVVNSGSSGIPDNLQEPSTPGYNVDSNNGVAYSPEDPDENGFKDNWGAADVGNGFGFATTTDPYQTVNTCQSRGRQNIVTGARHVLKLVDGGMGASITNLPMVHTNTPPTGGFTVASENPVYVEGDYNSDSSDTIWALGTDDSRPHAAAAIIADAVSLLSNPPTGINPNGWTDQNSMANPLNLSARVPVPTHFRVAIAAGKSMNFPHPVGTGADFGTDGGVHNFLRLLENWGGIGLYYRGSLVSLYYSEYATGTFKCCGYVYGAPSRNFYFDTDFQNPANLPPGTPMLEDVNNLSERQDFTPQ